MPKWDFVSTRSPAKSHFVGFFCRLMGRVDPQEGECLPDRWFAWGSIAYSSLLKYGTKRPYAMVRLPSWQWEYDFCTGRPRWFQLSIVWLTGVPEIRWIWARD